MCSRSCAGRLAWQKNGRETMLASLAKRERVVRARARRETERKLKALRVRYREALSNEIDELRASIVEADRMLDALGERCSCDACRQARAREQRRAISTAHRSEMRDLITRLKGTRCSKCAGEYEPRELHFHHRDPAAKLFGLGTGKTRDRTEREIRDEIAKCTVLCRSCHRVEHPHLAGG